MTEREWMECTEPQPMLDLLRGKVSDRKLRLFACACARRLWRLTGGVDGVVAAGERFADGAGVAERDELMRIRTAQLQQPQPEILQPPFVMARQSAADAAWALLAEDAWEAARTAVSAAGVLDYEHASRHPVVEGPATRAERQVQCAVLRDVIGNPFRALTILAVWRSPDVCRLADAIYQERNLPSGHLERNRVAILADALEEAGGSEDVLEHIHGGCSMRSKKKRAARETPGTWREHVRGCWVVDLILSKDR